MKGLLSSIIALAYGAAIIVLLYMSAAPALSPESGPAPVARATVTVQPS